MKTRKYYFRFEPHQGVQGYFRGSQLDEAKFTLMHESNDSDGSYLAVLHHPTGTYKISIGRKENTLKGNVEVASEASDYDLPKETLESFLDIPMKLFGESKENGK